MSVVRDAGNGWLQVQAGGWIAKRHGGTSRFKAGDRPAASHYTAGPQIRVGKKSEYHEYWTIAGEAPRHSG